MPLEVRLAETKEDAEAVFSLYRQMHAEGCVPPSAFHALKTMTNVMRLVSGPGSCVLMAMDGDDVAGVLSLYEEAYWWSEDRHITDKGLYVRPEWRDGGALDLLLNAAKNLSDDTGLPVYLTIFNARRRRGGRSGWERVGATLGYINHGATIAHFPEG